YLCTFYYFNPPRSSLLDNYIVLLCLLYCVSGIAYALAIYLESGFAQLWSVLLPVVLTLVSTQDDDKGTILPLLKRLAYPSWALEAFVLANAERLTCFCMDIVPPRLANVLAYLIPISKGSTVKSVISRIVIVASTYYIWQERNARLLTNKSQSSTRLFEINGRSQVGVWFEMGSCMIRDVSTS
ncbi:hypothetical protein Tco_1414789, partial [Tanacetum coccineum]